MQRQTLTNRKTQMLILADACTRGVGGYVTRRGQDPDGPSENTHLLVLDRDCLWMRWPISALSEPEQFGVIVDVRFELNGQTYTFSAETKGRFERSFGVFGPVAALCVQMPVRIERCEQRQDGRLDLDETDAIEAQLIQVQDERVRETLRLTNISTGGIGGTMHWQAAQRIDDNALYWAEFNPNNDPCTFDFVVRLIHKRPAESGQMTVTGWEFCPGDDQDDHRANINRLRDIVQQRRQAAR